ncbi:Gmad2 immunoglobulin-like domain-containing protein [Candidatus Contubernalis alkaliaceticus]|uniref:Gmad2 immunoglobulin-like domain-containing protein n=1 Tax=Candidatus Contubernalis alkaliaceticus TaxID=338645 RepID=UPI001F4BD431|nr:Gmad2 immunoglobulin-like domain-containing protein [Candidatus Contubernalis alkalaceticus]UNC93405.1 protease complex subunit PrcB family protein [Candidatus Contubernalis alkalaceticus]
MLRKVLVFSLIMVLIVSLSLLGMGCESNGDGIPDENPIVNGNGSENGNDNEDNNNDHEEPIDSEKLPEEIEDWLNSSLTMNMGQSRVYEDELYILVTYGEKATGGYEVNITDVNITGESVEVSVDFKAPKEGDMVTQVITYPYALEVIEKVNLPVIFILSGDEEYLMILRGVEELKPIVAESPFIKIFEPAPNSTVGDKFSISGIASVYEGNIVYEIIDENGKSLYEHYTTAGMGDWYHFEIDINLPEETSNSFKVEMYSPSAIDGSKTNLVSLPLKISD